MNEIFHQIIVNWRTVAEISVFWFVFYLIFVYIKDSGMAQALKGIVFLGAFYLIAEYFELKSIQWILSHLFQISIIGAIIIFQPELRRGLSRIGQTPLFKILLKEEKVIDEIVRASSAMAKDHIGALIAIEREMSLKPVMESGIMLDGALTAELLITIFSPNTPFHDGGVVIQSGRVMAVGCLFPLSQSPKLSKTMGTRHRAGLGLSEDSDAFVIVVSQEKGSISVMNKGKITSDVDEAKLRTMLLELKEPVKK